MGLSTAITLFISSVNAFAAIMAAYAALRRSRNGNSKGNGTGNGVSDANATST